MAASPGRPRFIRYRVEDGDDLELRLRLQRGRGTHAAYMLIVLFRPTVISGGR